MRLKKSGPKNDVRGPLISVPGSWICERLMTACDMPPWLAMTPTITATMPISMIMPWTKSFITVAMYPPSTT